MGDETDSISLSWPKRLGAWSLSVLSAMHPAVGAVVGAKDFISEAVAQRVRDEASVKATSLMLQAHLRVLYNILWQNGLLMFSLGPVYALRAPWPFYVAYAIVVGYTLYSVFDTRALIWRLVRTRSVTKTLSLEVREAIEQELTQRQLIERKAVEWLGPDIEQLSADVARKLRPDVVAAVSNMAFTLFMAFLAFRVFALPLLEQKALLH